METMRVAYWNKDGEASEAIVEAEDADAAIAQLEDYGHGASVTAVGPAAVEPPVDAEVNEGDNGVGPNFGPADDLTLSETREVLDQANAEPPKVADGE